MVFKPAGTVTGLYREDQGYDPTAAAFNPYRDVYREHQAAGTENKAVDDTYEVRTRQRHKGDN
jgi:hypothetical protein